MWYVYILECNNGILYTGITNDLTRRTKQHQSGKGAKFTHAFGAKKIVYHEELPTRSAALKREAEVKKLSRCNKLNLIKNTSKSRATAS